MTIYRGFDIKPHALKGGFFYWTNGHGFSSLREFGEAGSYPTEDKAMDAIDAYRRNLAKAG